MLYHYSGAIPARYWIALCENPEYGHLELVKLVDRSFPEILRNLTANTNNLTSLSLVSLGPGTGDIDLRMLRHLEEELNVRCYCCIDFSFELLRYAANRISTAEELKNAFPIKAVWGNFATPGNFLNREDCVRLFSLTGFTLGNYDEEDLLGNISSQMTAEDFLLVDAHLHDLEEMDARNPMLLKKMVPLLISYSQEETNRFVFGPVEAATKASPTDVSFDCRAHREMTAVPNAVNVTIFCKELETSMRLTGELIKRKRVDLATTTFYRYPDLLKWFPKAGFDCLWHKREGCMALFLLKRTRSHRNS